MKSYIGSCNLCDFAAHVIVICYQSTKVEPCEVKLHQILAHIAFNNHKRSTLTLSVSCSGLGFRRVQLRRMKAFSTPIWLIPLIFLERILLLLFIQCHVKVVQPSFDQTPKMLRGISLCIVVRLGYGSSHQH